MSNIGPLPAREFAGDKIASKLVHGARRGKPADGCREPCGGGTLAAARGADGVRPARKGLTTEMSESGQIESARRRLAAVLGAVPRRWLLVGVAGQQLLLVEDGSVTGRWPAVLAAARGGREGW